ncbi:hypothetical protein L218DRAFT_1081114 [Marasmius fiardii PR-910]|nr:hypothetical protein L218DRAFT_1081114 [Marasmius fiardii PR-910]
MFGRQGTRTPFDACYELFRFSTFAIRAGTDLLLIVNKLHVLDMRPVNFIATLVASVALSLAYPIPVDDALSYSGMVTDPAIFNQVIADVDIPFTSLTHIPKQDSTLDNITPNVENGTHMLSIAVDDITSFASDVLRLLDSLPGRVRSLLGSTGYCEYSEHPFSCHRHSSGLQRYG